MRIIGGARRGLHLVPVGAGDPAAHLRPTSDRVREAIFNLIINGKASMAGDPVIGARVLDLFAGTGALGLEALSRGAAEVSFVETGRAAQALIKANIDRMQAQLVARLVKHDATRLPPHSGPGFTLVFLDPPYGKVMGEAALQSALAGGWMAPGALIVWEESAPPVIPPGTALVDQRRYGDTVVTLLRAAG
jgi:16S rRNA (guanine966-N2)-methyltransferase